MVGSCQVVGTGGRGAAQAVDERGRVVGRAVAGPGDVLIGADEHERGAVAVAQPAPGEVHDAQRDAERPPGVRDRVGPRAGAGIEHEQREALPELVVERAVPVVEPRVAQSAAARRDQRRLVGDVEHEVQRVELGVLRGLDLRIGAPAGALAGGAVVVEVGGEQLGREDPHVRDRRLDHTRLDRSPLGLVGVEEPGAAPAVEDGGELPAEVDGVADAGVEPVAAERGVEMGSVAGEEHAAVARVVDELHPGGPGVVRQDLRRDRRAGHAVDDRVRLAPAAVLLDAERDDPPGARAVERPHERGRGRVDDPVVHGRAVAHHRPELGRVEHHAVVRAQGVLADVRGADRVAHDAARAVGADDVVGGDRATRTAAVLDRDADLARVLHETATRRPVASVTGSSSPATSRSSSSRTYCGACWPSSG